ncbi:MAG: sigma-70 family RNA polymerase sigma factor [bacterium]|nr:sigma-70 family RNA polymerase sigma factor [bacterium]
MAAETDSERLQEIELIRRARRGEEAAFSALLGNYNTAMLNYCHRLVGSRDLAADLAQETFIKAFLSIDKFDESKKFSPWIYRIAHNLCVDYLRKKRLPTEAMHYEGTDGDEVLVDIADSTAAPDALLERKEVNEHFEEALAALDGLYREPLVLRHQEQLSYQDISETLDIPIGTVKARIHRGRGLLKEKLVEYA